MAAAARAGPTRTGVTRAIGPDAQTPRATVSPPREFHQVHGLQAGHNAEDAGGLNGALGVRLGC